MKNCKHCLKIVTALKHTKTTQTFNSFNKKHIHIHYVGTSIQSWLALNAKYRGFSPSHIKIDFIIKIGIWWFSNKLTALREKNYNKKLNTLCEVNSRK